MKILKNILKILGILGILFFFWAAFVYFSFDKTEFLKTFQSRYSKVLYDRNGELLSVFLNQEDQWHIQAREIPQRLKIAVINYEDRNFYSHKGVDFLALLRALKNNIFLNQRTGASTISMQTIKLWDKKNRTYLNKLNEIISQKMKF